MRLMRRLTVVVTGCALSLGWMASLGASASMRAEQICLSDEPPLRVVTDCPDTEAAVDVSRLAGLNPSGVGHVVGRSWWFPSRSMCV